MKLSKEQLQNLKLFEWIRHGDVARELFGHIEALEQEALGNPEKQTHIRIVRDLHQGIGGTIKAGTELFGRMVQMDPLCQMFQCTIGELSGREIPFKHYVEIAEGKTYAEQRVIELEQENLQKREEVRILMRDRAALNDDVIALTQSNNAYINENAILDQTNSKLCKRLVDLEVGTKELELENGLPLASLERGMLDHQPVVLPKEVAEAITTCRRVMSGIQIVTSLDNINQLFRDYDNSILQALEVIKHFAQQVVSGGQDLMSGLVNGYTVEQAADPIKTVAGMLNIWSDAEYLNGVSVDEQNEAFAKEIIDFVEGIKK